MATYNNATIARIYTTYHSQNCWAYISGTGWRRIQTGNADGHRNVHILTTAARANGKTMTLVTDSDDARIERAYL